MNVAGGRSRVPIDVRTLSSRNVRPVDVPERAGDTARVDLLVSPNAKDHLHAIPDSYRQDAWVYSGTEGGMGSNYLTWRNTDGDRIVYRFLSPGIDLDPGPQHRIRDVIWNP